MKKVGENPFNKMPAMKALLDYQNKDVSFIKNLLRNAYAEIKNAEDKKLFHVICFNKGSVANRQHNIFGNKTIEQGGESDNEFWVTYLNWLLVTDKKQFIKFLPLFIEYVGDRELASCQVRTLRKSSNVVSTWGLLAEMAKDAEVWNAYIQLKAKHIVSGTVFQKHQTAKFFHIPRLSKRKKIDGSGKRNLTSETIKKMKVFEKLMVDISKEANLEVTTNSSGKAVYSGFKKFKRLYQGDLVDYLFSTKEILKLDSEQILGLLNKLPNGARNRFKLMIRDASGNLKKPEYANLLSLYTTFEKSKEDAQRLQRELMVKQSSQTLSLEETLILEKAKKDGKVNTGASTLFSEIDKIANSQGDEIALESIFNKIEFGVKCRVIVDYSGSMNGRPKMIGSIAATAAMLKSASNFDAFFGFSSNFTVFENGTVIKTTPNRYMSTSSVKTIVDIDRKKSFYHNFTQVYSAYQEGLAANTDPVQVAYALERWVNSSSSHAEKSMKIEEILETPVLLIISDGDFNCSDTPGSSLHAMKQRLLTSFGYNPLIVVWNIPRAGEGSKSEQFKNVNNVIHVSTYNPSVINQIFTKLGDIESIDIYTQLKTLYESNRFDEVKSSVL